MAYVRNAPASILHKKSKSGEVMNGVILYSRIWAMPNAETFSILPIESLVRRYLANSRLSLDPFARNKRWATWTNDLNPNTEAEYHLDSLDFLALVRERGVQADLVLFDPPYSPRQIKEMYDSIGLTMGAEEALRTNWQKERSIIHKILVMGGIVISCGWNSVGMGKERGYEFIEGILVCHGMGHNDTIVTVERKAAFQPGLL